jgi:hypothetical protein
MADDASGRHVLVAGSQTVDDLGNTDAQGAQPRFINDDVYLPFLAADQSDLSNTRNCGELANHPLVGNGCQLRHPKRCGADGNRKYRRVRWVRPRHDRCFCRFRKVGFKGCYFFADVLSRIRALDLELKHRDDDGFSFVGGRCNLIEATDCIQCFLDLSGHLSLNRLWGRARIARRHNNNGNIYVWKFVDPEAPVGKCTEYKQRDHHHGGEDRVVDRNAGQKHVSQPLRS